MSSQPNNPLHGLTLKAILEHLVDTLGWSALADKIRIRCFAIDPSLDSSLKFLRRTPWARTKLELLYLAEQGFDIPELKDKSDKHSEQTNKLKAELRRSPSEGYRTQRGQVNKSNRENFSAAVKTAKTRKENVQHSKDIYNNQKVKKSHEQTLTLNKPKSTNSSKSKDAHKHSVAIEQGKSDNAHIWGNPKG